MTFKEYINESLVIGDKETFYKIYVDNELDTLYRIPKEFVDFIYNKKNNNYKFSYDSDKGCLMLTRATKNIIGGYSITDDGPFFLTGLDSNTLPKLGKQYGTKNTTTNLSDATNIFFTGGNKIRFSNSGTSIKDINSTDWEFILIYGITFLLSKKINDIFSADILYDIKTNGGKKLNDGTIKRYAEWLSDDVNHKNVIGIASTIVQELDVRGPVDIYKLDSVNTTNFWNRRGCRDKTPKTDIVVGSYGISLKNANGSQLMSGGKHETQATLDAALDMFSKDSENKDFDMLQKKIGSITNSGWSKFKGTVTNLRKSEKNSNGMNMKSSFSTADNENKTATDNIRNLMNDNSTLRKYFVYEAMTGTYKFGNENNNNMRAIPTHIVNFDPIGNKTKVLKASLDTADKIAKQCNFTINFKSSNGNIWTALRAIIGNDKKLIESLDDCLNEGILDNITNFIKMIGSKLRQNLIGFIRILFDKIEVRGTDNIKI